MAYFTQDYIDFFSELKENNHKEWFHAHKKRYENAVKKPFHDFVQVMIDRVAELDPRVNIDAKDAIMRINKDIRFSKDKTPYNTSMRAIISATGRKDKTHPGMFLRIGSDSIGYYGGLYATDKAQLQAIREAIADDPDGFEELLEDPDFKARFGTLQGDKNKRLPKEFQEAAKRQPLLFNKGFYYTTNLDIGHALRDDLPELLLEHWKVATPIMEFLQRALGK